MPSALVTDPNYGYPSRPLPLDPTVAAAQQQMQQSTFGRANELQNDPYQKSVMSFLQGQMNGTNVPYTDTVKNSILAQQGRGASDAEQAQMASLRESLGASGGSIYDPGYQAAQREAMSQRQGQNLDAQGQLNTQAGLANFQAQNQGANQLAAARGAQNAQINQMKLAGNANASQVFAQVPTNPKPRQMSDPLAHLGNGQSISSQNQAVF